MLARIALPTARRALCYSEAAISHARAYHPPAHYKPPSMDDLPVPQGSWKADYESRQRKYNLQFIVGVSFLTFTVGFMSQSGLLEFNYSQPKLE
ncbi:hypothetical protein C0J52_22668 [Blattella germanica]|nr:hypothetical protein C0J52_22668 [Blattella germanica]